MDFSLGLFVAVKCKIATLRQFGLVPAPHRFLPSPAPKYTLCPLPKLDETVDQTSGIAQMCRSLRTVALDLARRPRPPRHPSEMKLQISGRGPKKGFIWLATSLRIAHSLPQNRKKKKKLRHGI